MRMNFNTAKKTIHQFKMAKRKKEMENSGGNTYLLGLVALIEMRFD